MDHRTHERQNILSINIDGRLSLLLELGRLLNKYKPIVCAIQDAPALREKHSDKENLLGINEISSTIYRDYSIVKEEEDEKTGRNKQTSNLTLIRKDLSILEVHRWDTEVSLPRTTTLIASKHGEDDIDMSQRIACLATRIEFTSTKQGRYIIFNVYIRPRATQQETMKLMEWMKNTSLKCGLGQARAIIVGDVNAYNPLWAPIEENIENKEKSEKHYKQIKEARGRIIASTVQNLRLTVLNRIEQGPTFTGKGRNKDQRAYIDIALVGEKALRSWTQFKLVNLSEDSAHKAVIISTNHRTHTTNRQGEQRGQDKEKVRATKDTNQTGQHTKKEATFCRVRPEKLNEEHLQELRIKTDNLITNWRYLNRETAIDRLEIITDTLYEELLKAQEMVTELKTRNNKVRAFEIGKANSRTRRLQGKLSKMESNQQQQQRQQKRQRKRRKNSNKEHTEGELRQGEATANNNSNSNIESETREETRKRQSLQHTRQANIRILKIKRKLMQSIIQERTYKATNDKQQPMFEEDEDLWDKFKRINRELVNMPTEIIATATTTEPSKSASRIETTNTTVNMDQDTIEELAKQKFPQLPRDYANKENEHFRNTRIGADIDRKEIDTAIRELRNKRYTTPEGIKMAIFVRAIAYIKPLIYTIAEMSFKLLHIPKKSRLTLGTLIPKKAANQFRIVHVSSPISALLELIALHRLEYKLESNKLISPYQFGFTANRSRQDLVARILEISLKHANRYQPKPHSTNVLGTTQNNEQTSERVTTNIQRQTQGAKTTLISLDIEGAFDNVDQDYLIQKLQSELRRDPITYWLAEFIINRQIKIKIDNTTSNIRNVCKGVPQGSALGPTLWNYAIHDLENGLTIPGQLELLKYADDIIMIITSENKKVIQAALDTLSQKLLEARLNVRAEKCSTMIITVRGKRNQSKPRYTINGSPIKLVDTINVLGIHITQHLRLDTKSTDQMERIMKATRMLHKINTMQIINKAIEWQTLIDSFIRSRIIINNWPLIAIEWRAQEWADTLMIKILRIIFNWSSATSRKLIMMITKTADAKSACIKIAETRATITQYSETYNFLLKMADVSTSKELIENPEHQDNLIKSLDTTREPLPQQMNTSTTTNNRTQISKLMQHNYHNPEKLLREVKFENIFEAWETVGPIWFTIDRGRKGSIMAELYQDTIMQIKIGRHTEYPIGYFNTLALIWKISEHNDNEYEDNIIMNRYIATTRNSSLYAALNNTKNRDWRIITLRERLHSKGWRFVEIDNESYKHISTHILRYMDTKLKDHRTTGTETSGTSEREIEDFDKANENANNNRKQEIENRAWHRTITEQQTERKRSKQTGDGNETMCPIHWLNLDSPRLNDYVTRNRINKNYEAKMEKNYHKALSTIARELCNNTTDWQKITPNWLDGTKMLMLSGLYNNKEGRLVHETDLNRIEGCTECLTQQMDAERRKDEGESQIETGHQHRSGPKSQVLHRALFCTSYRSLQKEIRESLRFNPQEWNNDTRKELEMIIKDNRRSQRLLRLLTKAAFKRYEQKETQSSPKNK